MPVRGMFGELIIYGLKLEKAALEVRRLVDAGSMDAALGLIQAAAQLAEEHDLEGEVQAMALARNMEQATAARELGRLH
jgi:hypothetical protein